ncbi:hypothetical protein THAOC_33967, partial [Thalassiosira oceanica]
TIELPKVVLDILRPAFEQSRIKGVYFENSRHAGHMADFVKKVLQSNRFVDEVGFGIIEFTREDVKTVCTAIKSRNAGDHSINILTLANCSEGRIDTHTLKLILGTVTTAGAMTMTVLALLCNGMSSQEAAVIAKFLSSNPSLTHLYLDKNRFDDADAAVLANSLSNNTSLREISVENNVMKEDGRLAFLRAIFDVSSLSSCAASNHNCRVYGFERDISVLNKDESTSVNKWSKIFVTLALSSEDSFINTALLRGVPAPTYPDDTGQPQRPRGRTSLVGEAPYPGSHGESYETLSGSNSFMHRCFHRLDVMGSASRGRSPDHASSSSLSSPQDGASTKARRGNAGWRDHDDGVGATSPSSTARFGRHPLLPM